MAKIKGSAVRSSLAYLEDRLGKDGLKKVLAVLPEQDRKILESAILQSNWYELSVLLRLMDAAEMSVSSAGLHGLAWDMGRFSADFGLKGIYRVFMRVADPHFIIRKSSEVFSTYYDSGVMAAEKVDSRHAVLRLTAFNQPHKAFCDRLCGFMQRSLEISGCEAVLMTHPKCMARGDAFCQFEAQWE